MANQDSLMTLTAQAVEYAKRLLEKEEISVPPGGIRFLVQAGGCSGLELHYKLERTDDRHDIIILIQELRVLIDPKSMTQLRDLEIDHTDNLTDKPFVVRGSDRNTCGCGTSFQPKSHNPENKT